MGYIKRTRNERTSQKWKLFKIFKNPTFFLYVWDHTQLGECNNTCRLAAGVKRGCFHLVNLYESLPTRASLRYSPRGRHIFHILFLSSVCRNRVAWLESEHCKSTKSVLFEVPTWQPFSRRWSCNVSVDRGLVGVSGKNLELSQNWNDWKIEKLLRFWSVTFICIILPTGTQKMVQAQYFFL